MYGRLLGWVGGSFWRLKTVSGARNCGSITEEHYKVVNEVHLVSCLSLQ